MRGSARAVLTVAAVLGACSGCGGGGGGGGAAGAGSGDGPPALALSSTSVALLATASGDALPAARTVTIRNGGGGTLAAPTVTVAAGGGWLDASLAASTSGWTLSLRPNTSLLTVGPHATTVEVASAGAAGSPGAVAVSWQITAAPGAVLVPSAPALAFLAQTGADPAPQVVAVYDGGAVALDPLAVSTDVAWLNPSVAGTTVTVAAVVAGLSGGVHTGHVGISAAGATNSPLSVPVTFVVLEPTLAVSTERMSFAATVGQDPPEQTRAILNAGTGVLGTVTATPATGIMNAWVTGAGNAQTLHVHAFNFGTVDAVYDSTLTVAAAHTSNGAVHIPVRLVMSTPPPALSTGATTTLAFGTIVGSNPPPQPIAISNTSGWGTLAPVVATPSYTTGSGWMSAVVTGSGNAQTVTVSVTAPGVVGVYTGSLSLSAAGALNSPRVLPVTLRVNADAGSASAGISAYRTAELGRELDCGFISTFAKTSWEREIAAFVLDAAAAVSAGRLGYSQASADACLAAVNGETCAEVDHYANSGAIGPSACTSVLVGQVGNGAGCATDGECAAGYCKFGTTCPGTCTAFKGLGKSCLEARECAAGQTCIGYCAAKTAPGGTGQACSNGTPKCKIGNYCDSGGICRARIALNGACSLWPPRTCVAGASCALQQSKCLVDADAGQSCQYAWCRRGTDCTAAKVCAGGAPPGGDCTADGLCADGNRCVGTTTKTCVDLTAGMDCTAAVAASWVTCSDGSYCLGGATKTCAWGSAGVGMVCDTFAGAGADPTRLCAPVANAVVSCVSGGCQLLACQ